MEESSLSLESVFSEVARFRPLPRISVGEAPSPEWTLACDLFADPDAVDDMLAYQRSFTPDLDRKGQAAYAIGDYSQMLAIAAVVPFVGFRLVPDFSPDACAVGFDNRPIEHKGRQMQEREWRMGLLRPHAATDSAPHGGKFELVGTDELCDRLRSGFEAHLGPLVDALHRQTNLSRNALWRLAGDSISQLFLDAGRRFGCLEKAKTEGMAVLKQPGSPLSNRQMHYFDIAVADDCKPDETLLCVTFRARGGCCRFYTVEGGHLCSTCVLQDPDERDAKLEQRLRRGLEQTRQDGVAKAGMPV